jgi:aspartate aminotransferase
MASPVQEVAAYAFSEPSEVRAHIRSSARLHGTVALAVHGIVTRQGADCRPPTGAFYLYPDFEERRAQLARWGITDSARLQDWLLNHFGVAVMSGSALGDDPRALRVKLATGMLYGETADEQRAALNSDAPLKLANISDKLDRIEEAFAALCSEPVKDGENSPVATMGIPHLVGGR